MKKEQTPNKKRRYRKMHQDEPQEIPWKNIDAKELIKEIDEATEDLDRTIDDINRHYH